MILFCGKSGYKGLDLGCNDYVKEKEGTNRKKKHKLEPFRGKYVCTEN